MTISGVVVWVELLKSLSNKMNYSAFDRLARLSVPVNIIFLCFLRQNHDDLSASLVLPRWIILELPRN